jgi:hypothetical protein
MLHAAPHAEAAGRIRLTADSVEMGGLEAHQVAFSLTATDRSRLTVEFYAASIEGLEATGSLRSLRFACAGLAVSGDSLDCRRGRLSGQMGRLGSQDTPLQLSVRGDRRLHASATSLAFGAGRAGVEADLDGSSWSATVQASALPLGELARLPQLAARIPAGFTLAGQLSGSARITGEGAALAAARLDAELAGTSFADAAGALAGEQLGARLEASIDRPAQDTGWAVQARLRSAGGQAYVEPVFIDFGARPVVAELSGRLDGALQFIVDAFRVDQPGVGVLDGSAELDLAGDALVRRARFHLQGVDLSGLLSVYGSPFLISTQFADLQAAGHVEGEAWLDDGLPSRLQLTLSDVALDSTTGSLSVAGLEGRLNWFAESLRNELAPTADSAIFESALSWQSARLWGIEFGQASIPFTTTGNHFRLLDPVMLPIFDGGLAIGTLRIRHAGTPQMYLRFDAELKPVSVGLLTRALGWPEFGGTISGRIPQLELADGFVTIGGDIEAQVFDGTIRIRELRMRDPLGQYPQLFADVDVDRLDLALVTSTFEFGSITGRLSGRVAGLEMFDWMPVAFDASIHTTPGDRSPHRISQRAVSNLSSIGGGSGGSVAATMQSGFLRFFKSFRYDRIGLSCRLANDVCEMGGAGRAETGYYIVKGAGLPRVDVVSSQRQVAWTRLVRQLATILESPETLIIE